MKTMDEEKTEGKQKHVIMTERWGGGQGRGVLWGYKSCLLSLIVNVLGAQCER